jgi:hypothetical protein
MISYPAASLRVFGIDLSFTDTGIGDFQDGIVARSSVKTDPHNYPGVAVKKKGKVEWHLTEHGVRLRLDDIGNGIFTAIGTGPRPVLITMEGPSFGSKGNALHQLGGVWWIVFRELERAGHTVAVITPSTLKLYGAGNGSATKSDMRVALLQRANVDERNDNRVDGHFLAAAGSEYLGHPLFTLPKRQREALDKVAWPNMAAPAIAS